MPESSARPVRSVVVFSYDPRPSVSSRGSHATRAQVSETRRASYDHGYAQRLEGRAEQDAWLRSLRSNS